MSKILGFDAEINGNFDDETKNIDLEINLKPIAEHGESNLLYEHTAYRAIREYIFSRLKVEFECNDFNPTVESVKDMIVKIHAEMVSLWGDN